MRTSGIKSFHFPTPLINQASLEVKGERGVYLHLSLNLYSVACFKMVLPENICIFIKMPITFVPSVLSDWPHFVSDLCMELVIYTDQTPAHPKDSGV